MAGTRGVAFQATDLARRHREVVDCARAGEALVRDKDGTLLTFAPTADVERERELLTVLSNYLRMDAALRIPVPHRTTSAYGDFAWATSLDEADQNAFLGELVPVALVAASGGPMEPVRDVLYGWRATAEIAGNPDLAAELSEDLPEPLDIEL